MNHWQSWVPQSPQKSETCNTKQITKPSRFFCSTVLPSCSVLKTCSVLFEANRWTARFGQKEKRPNTQAKTLKHTKSKIIVGNCFRLALFRALFRHFLFDLTTENPFHFTTPASHWEVDARLHTSMARPAETCSCFQAKMYFYTRLEKLNVGATWFKVLLALMEILVFMFVDAGDQWKVQPFYETPLKLLPFPISRPFACVFWKSCFSKSSL